MTSSRAFLLTLLVALPLGASAQRGEREEQGLSTPPLPTEEEEEVPERPDRDPKLDRFEWRATERDPAQTEEERDAAARAADGAALQGKPAEPAPPPATTEPIRRVRPPDAPVGTFSLIGHGEEASVLARGELVVGQTAHGITQAVLICLWLECNTAQQYAGALLVGGLAGGLGSFLLTSGGISGGPALAINAGLVWGFVEGVLVLNVVQGSGSGWAAILSGTTLLGGVAGAALGGLLHPTGGQVAMASSGGLWAGVLVALFSSPFQAQFSTAGFAGMELAAVNVGMLGFGLLASKLNYSRGRMFLIDVGGVIGGLVGSAAFLFAQVPANQLHWLGPTAGVGVLAGLAGTVLLTSGIDTPAEAPAEMSMVPVGPEGSTGVSIGARF